MVKEKDGIRFENKAEVKEVKTAFLFERKFQENTDGIVPHAG